ncbi:MAG: oligosaccharide flippase family protein, partial [Clostridia bacterium]|nr:oligosaccharide flippase family protein [Clostridia bacterium]
MKRGKLLFNTVILTVSSLAVRALGLLFKIFISNKIGAEGVGLFQLIFSVYFLFITIVTAGISLGVTRMVSEKIASQNEKAISRIMRGCMGFSVATGLFCTVIMYLGAELICAYWIRDIRCINAVKVLSLSLPFMAMASCLKGYFIGVRRVMKSSAVQVFEQISRIIIVVLLIGFFIPADISFSLEIIAWGDTLSEIIAFILLLSLYLGERKHNKSESSEIKFSPVKRLIGICSPILTSSLARSLLSSYENILIPHGLSKTGLSKEQSLSKYGALKGMTMPILFFPSSILSAFSTLLVPEITYYSAKNRWDKVSEIIKKVIKITFIMSFFIFIIFFSCGKGIGRLIYNNSDVSFFLVAVSPLVPLMYMESVVDGMLKA